MADIQNSYFKAYRKMTDWEWYKDIPVNILFNHLLRIVNYTDKKWRGIEVKKGETITSVQNLSLQTALSPMQIRTAINKLKSTNEITSKTTSTFTHIKVVKWEEYQIQTTSSITNEQQTDNKRITTTKERYKGKKERIQPSFFLYQEGNEFQDPFWYIYSNFIIEKREVLDECFKMSVFVENNERFQWKQFVTNWIIKSYRRREQPLAKKLPEELPPQQIQIEKPENFHITDMLKDEEQVDA